jgi:diacylglycerol kinase
MQNNFLDTIATFLSKRLRSFGYAFKGIMLFWNTQTNAKIQVLCSLFLLILAILFQIMWYEWALLVFAMTLVVATETMNTAVEFLTDLVSPNYNEKAGKVKDLAAGAVLLSAIGATIIILLVFVPKFMRIW